jgi:outer membrane autotransporter protein
VHTFTKLIGHILLTLALLFGGLHTAFAGNLPARVTVDFEELPNGGSSSVASKGFTFGLSSGGWNVSNSCGGSFCIDYSNVDEPIVGVDQKVSIKTSGDRFKFTSFKIFRGGYTSEGEVKGFRNGTQVAVLNLSGETVSLPSDFQDVDTIEIAISVGLNDIGGGSLVLDDLVFDPPVPAPAVTELSPQTGPAAGGTSVTITGTDFTGATAVKFGGTPATSFTVESATRIKATAPAGTGVVDVRVTTAGGTSEIVAADKFTYTTAQTITFDAPADRAIDSGTFDLSASASSNLPVTFKSATQKICSVSNITVSLLDVGKCTIIASVAAHGTIGAAQDVTRSFQITETIVAKPRLNNDPETKGGVNAQVDTLRRFANTQSTHVKDRLTSLRNRKTATFTNNLQVNGLAVSALITPTADVPSDELGDAEIRGWITGDITLGSRGGLDDLKFTTSGLTFGVDSELSQSLIAGIAFGYGKDDTDFGNNGTGHKAHHFSAAVYADLSLTPASFIDIEAGFSRGSFNIDRFSTAGNVVLSGDREATTLFGGLTFTHEIQHDGFILAPYGKLTVQHIMADAYTEDGASPWALSYADLDTTSVNGTLGVNTAYHVPVSWGSLTAKAHAEYSAILVGDFTQDLGYADGVGVSSVIDGKGLSSSQFKIGAGFDWRVDNMTGSLGYDYSLTGSDISAHNVKATVGFQF